MPHQLVVSRRKWNRGQGEQNAELLNQHGRYDIVGYYLSSLGVPDEQLRKKYLANNLDFLLIPRHAKWVLDDLESPNIYEINDADWMSDMYRETELVKMFAQHDVEVSFVD